MLKQQKNTFWPTLALIIITILWGGSFSMIKVALVHYHAFVVTFTRMALAAAMFGIFFHRGFRKVKVIKSDIPLIALMIFLEPCLFFAFEAYALYFTTASQAGMIVALTPMFMAVGALVFLHERPSPMVWLGFAVAIAGVMILSYDAEATDSAPYPVLGNILEGLAMCAAAGFVVCIKRLKGNYPPTFLAAWQAVGGAIFFFGLVFTPGVEWPSEWPLVPTLALIYLGVFITFLGISLYNYGLSGMPAARAAGLINLVPVFAVIFGVTLLDEHLTSLQWAASGLVIAGVLISQRAPVKIKAAPNGANTDKADNPASKSI